MPKKLSTPRKRPTRQELRDLDQEILFLEGIIRRDESYVEALQILGDDYTSRGRYAEGLKIDERLSKLRPEDSLVHYNLACSYSLMEHLDQALESLETALNLGYRDFKWMSQALTSRTCANMPPTRRSRTRCARFESKRAKTDLSSGPSRTGRELRRLKIPRFL